MKIRRLFAIWAAKLVTAVCKVTGKRGETLPGKIALQIDPSILKELSSQVREKIFVVCGTNGKTTTNNLLSQALAAEGYKVICNKTGSNMLNGVVSAFVISAGWNGRIDADYACIEIDEASTVRVFPHFIPDYMVLTNLFRDQLDRYGEIDITMDVLLKSIKMGKKIKLIINGDDSLITSLAIESKHRFVSFGISEQIFKAEKLANEIKEGSFCPLCGTKLHYEYYHYSQLGSYECINCNFKRPDIDYAATNIDLDNHIAFDVENRRIEVNYRGFYNIYNILAAYSAVRTADIAPVHFSQMLINYNPQNGRMEQFHIDGKSVILNLAKNPAGFNQNISAVIEDESPKDVIIMINDNAQDGTDISWLWDVDFERFKEANVNSMTVTGIRKYDMYLRLKYVDIKSDISNDVEKTIRKQIREGTGNLYVLVNYTALYSTHLILKKIEGEKAKKG